MTLKLKLPAFLSRTPDPAGETVTARTVLDSDRPASQRKIPFSADLLRQFPVAKQLQVLGGCLVLVMLLIAIVVYRDNRQATFNTAYIATAGDMRMLSQRLQNPPAWPCWVTRSRSSNCGNRVTASPAILSD
jgi:twitching motility protein PilJ